MARPTLKTLQNATMRDLERMTDRELRALARVGADVANKRITRLVAEPGSVSPALAGLKPNKDGVIGFSTSPTYTRKQLINTIRQEKTFIGKETSTVKGWREARVRIGEKYAEATGKRTRDSVSADKVKTVIRYDVSGAPVAIDVRDEEGKANTLTKKQVGKMWKAFHQAMDEEKIGSVGGKGWRGLASVAYVKAHDYITKTFVNAKPWTDENGKKHNPRAASTDSWAAAIRDYIKNELDRTARGNIKDEYKDGGYTARGF